MTETYVLKQMVSLAHTPFQIVNRDGSVELGVRDEKCGTAVLRKKIIR